MSRRTVAFTQYWHVCPIRIGPYSGEVALNWSNRVRQSHRWLSVAFTVAVLINIIALGLGESAVWVGLLALFPLVLLQLTGLYLLVLPYAVKWRSQRQHV